METTIQNSAIKAKSRKYYIHSLITIVIMFGFGYLSPLDPITPLGMRILGIFISLLYGWTFVNLVWSSILGMIALSLTGYAPLAVIMKEGFGSNTLLLMWAMLLIASLVDSSGVSKFIATYFVSQKFVLGKPWVLIFTFFCTICLMSAMSSSVPTIIIGWGILYYILNQLGYKAGDPISSYLVVGVVYCSISGSSIFPWKLLQNIVLGIFANTVGYQIEYSLYIAMTLPISIAIITGYVLLDKFIFRLDVEKLKLVTKDSFDPENLKINNFQKLFIYLLVLLVTLLLLPSMLPKAWAVTKVLRGLGPQGVAFFILGLLVFLRFNNQPMINIKKSSGFVPWDTIFLTAAMLPFTVALNVEATGINAFLVQKFSMLFNGLSPIMFIILVIGVSLILTQFMNNAVCGGILFPIIYPFSVAMDINPIIVTILMIVCLTRPLLTPAGSPMSALLFGNSEWVTAKDIYKYAVPGGIVIFICACLVGIPIGYLIF